MNPRANFVPILVTLLIVGLCSCGENDNLPQQMSGAAGSKIGAAGQTSGSVVLPPFAGAGTLSRGGAKPNSISISPSTAILGSASSQQFQLVSNGAQETQATWTANLGTITQSGLYLAPTVSTKTIDTVAAVSTADSSTYATAEITVMPVATSSQAVVPETFFAMSGSSGLLYSQPWPIVSFGDFRLWDTATGWEQINTAPGSFQWGVLDSWLTKIQAHHSNVTYTFGRVPAWASSKPLDTTCSYGPGSCDPPNDLSPDGSGSNQHWKDFVASIVQHAAGRIQTWELWNEPQNSFFWNGTVAQMVRMAKDAHDIIKAADPTAIFVSPGTGLGSRATNWTNNFLAAGGGVYVDAIAFHGYPACPVTASALPGNVAAFRAMLRQYGQDKKPLFDTEASWNSFPNNCVTDPDLQAAVVAQYYLLHWSSNVARFYWYQWNNLGIGTMWISSSTNPAGIVLKSGIAYSQVYNWMVGASLDQSCAVSGTLWSCLLSRGTYHALVLWDTSQTCSEGTCTAVPYPVDPQYVHYRDLSGNVAPITSGQVNVGIKPILLENQ